MRHASAFTGIGGFDLGFERAGLESVLQCEHDAACLTILASHWPAVRRVTDVRELTGRDLVEARADVFSFGSPCQGFSVAGLQGGLEDARSGLIHEAIRVIREAREESDGAYPTFAVWENVPGARSTNAGRDFRAVIAAFAELGASDIAWRTLDAQYFGVPQRRRRVFTVLDFGGERSGPVLFESASGARRSPPRRTKGQDNPGTVAPGAAGASGEPFVFESRFTRNGRGEPNQDGLAPALRAESGETDAGRGGDGPLVYEFETVTNPDNRQNPKPGDPAPTLGAGGRLHVLLGTFEQSSMTGRGTVGFDEADRARPLDTGADHQAIVYAIQDGGRGHDKYQNGLGVTDDGVMFTLDQASQHAVFVPDGDGIAPTLNADREYGYRGAGSDDFVFLPRVASALTPGVSSGRNAEVVGGLLTDAVAQTLGARDYKGAGSYMNGGIQGHALIRSRVRRLTPTEYQRCQGFPEGWNNQLGDSARYRQYGNAVAIPVAAWLGDRLRRAFEGQL